jgi:hypothetical protein
VNRFREPGFWLFQLAAFLLMQGFFVALWLIFG